MRWWQWTLGALAVAALLALATVWALREADVIRWGAAGAALDRVEVLKVDVASLEQQAGQEPPEDRFIVVNTDIIGWGEFCITYTTPGGGQHRCRRTVGVYDMATGETISAPSPDSPPIGECAVTVVFGDPLPTCYSASSPDSRSIVECFLAAVIGEPLPACWRSLGGAHADD